MIHISREIPCKIRRHAWNVVSLECYGFLIGSVETQSVYAALFSGKTRDWRNNNDLWKTIPDRMSTACALAASFHLEIVGLFHSTGDTFKIQPPPAEIAQTGLRLVLTYCTICCPQHSWSRYSIDGKQLCEGADYELSPGRRLTNEINGQRIYTAWNRKCGPFDYGNEADAEFPSLSDRPSPQQKE